MREFLDTNVIVRYLVQDHPVLGPRAAALIDSETRLVVPPVVLAEVDFVLRRVYGIDRQAVAQQLLEFVRKENICVDGLDRDLVVEALELCLPSGRVSVSDAMIWAAARRTPPGRLYSFDERFPAGGLEVRQP